MDKVMTHSPETSVFIMDPVLDDPRFDGLLFADSAKSFLGNDLPSEDFSRGTNLLTWKAPILQPVWKPQPVTGPVRPFNDYPCLELIVPAFHPRAVDALKDLLEPNGEILPLKHPKGAYYAYNIQTKADALNVKESTIIRYGNDGENKVALGIDRYVFHKAKLRSMSIFRLKERPQEVMVTEVFRQRVETSGLNGFRFTKIWPLPPGVDWSDDEAQTSRARSRKHDLQGEALVLRFRPATDSVNTKEKRLINSYAKQLEELLELQTTLDSAYFGAVEAVEFAEEDCRIYLTCPKVEPLVKFLEKWIQSNSWSGAFHIVKRFGNLYDTKARETRIAIK